MDNSVETTTTLRGRHTKVPAKCQHNGSLGAAVGGGGLLSSTPNPLPGFKGTARSNTGGASDTNTQNKGAAGGPGHVAPTASAQQRTGTRSPADHRSHEVDAILQDARFNSTSDGGSIRVGSSSSDSGNSDSESEDDDRGRQHGRGAGGADGGSFSGADGGSSSGADGGSSSGAGGGSSSGAGGGRLSRAGSSTAVESVARTMRQLQSSLNRNRNKSYNKCGYSRSTDTDKMAAGLTQLDIVMSRSSPYLADLEDKATGNSDSESEDDDRGRQHGRGAGGADGGSFSGADGGSSSGADGGSSSGAGGGSSSGAGGGRLSRAGSSTAVESVARTMRQLQSSLNRNRNKSYNKWGSPYLADLEDKATGRSPPSKPPASSAEAQRVPQNLITAVRAAIRSGLSPEPNKMYDCDGKSYTVAAIMAAIKEEDRADGRGEGIGQRRKSKHCVPRFCELLMHPQFRERFGVSRLQLSKKELDVKQKGTTRDIHLEIWEAFKDEKFKVPSSFADDSNIFGASINPNVVHQPDISFQKFATMRTDLFKDHGEMYSNFKKSGSNGEMFSFCKESLDTYYFGLTAEKCPDILTVCDQMLPDGTARESTGVETAGEGHSGAQGASADTSKRKVAKVESRERNVGVSGHQKKKRKQDAQIENTAKVAMSAVKGELGLDALFGTSSAPTYAGAPTSFYDTKEGLENKTTKLEHIAKLRKELQEIKKDIKKEKELGSDADEEDVQLLRDRATTFRAQITKETVAASEVG
ncbi:unnamed protein product [Ectocarpus sp. CCAP 1310/34]|nr:unnamed protein product [Ectocarpus sp. CCAP 1310/34]